MLAAVQKCVLGEPPVNGIKLEPRSTMLMLENALATEKLSPSRQWVPWLTINDEPVCKTDKDFAKGTLRAQFATLLSCMKANYHKKQFKTLG